MTRAGLREDDLVGAEACERELGDADLLSKQLERRGEAPRAELNDFLSCVWAEICRGGNRLGKFLASQLSLQGMAVCNLRSGGDSAARVLKLVQKLAKADLHVSGVGAPALACLRRDLDFKLSVKLASLIQSTKLISRLCATCRTLILKRSRTLASSITNMPTRR